MEADIERSVMRKVGWRLVPFLGLAYFISALDRFNVSIAVLTMNKTLGLSATSYGLGAGAFFWSYVLFQWPANAVLTRVGARWWLAIMISWGICSAGTAFATNATTFVAIRFVLGAAEAGYFPGVIWFMTRWFPSRHRGRAMGIFYACAAAAGALGGPLSGNLLLLDGWHGLAGWQWLFLIEGIPAAVLAIACPFILRNQVSEGHFLAANEREWLEKQLDRESRQSTTQNLTLTQALATPMIVVLTIGYLLIGFGIYSKNFFLPLMIKGMGFDDQMAGYLSALPYVTGVLAMIVLSRSSDRTGERVWHCAGPCLIAGVGLMVVGFTLGTHPMVAMAAYCVAGFGISGSLPTFWNLPTEFLGPAAAAGGIAIISAIGNISGYVAPQMVGIVRDYTGNYEVPMMLASLFMLAAGVCVVVAPRMAARLEARPAE
jgi:ACS family tartrate transporter-like MFS transporter